MKFLIALVCAVSVLGHEGHDHAEEASEPTSNVITLTDGTINNVIKEHPSLLVEFYAPWCGHCKRLAPEYEKAANILKETGSKGVLAKLDATVEKTAASAWSIRGYPTLLYFENGEMVEKYAGGRSAEDIAKFISEKAEKVPQKAEL